VSPPLAKRLKVLEAKRRPRRVRVVVWDRSEGPRPTVDAAPGEEVHYVIWQSGAASGERAW
jgi:hypothetical protein